MMLSSYKEVVYGVVFGLGAAVLDTVMDARTEGLGFFSELGHHPGMILYRALFVVFGFLLGWLLWKNHKREGDIRQLMEDVRRFHQEYESQAVVLHTNLQLLLTRNLQLPADTEALLRNTYEKSRDLQALVKQRPVV